ncbi:GIY-YIG nuclease family protein [candidate division FCPU426 bacterium]|nr:GIY-YIG nuclease family protein [candidate division FCPU426 bacterium]
MRKETYLYILSDQSNAVLVIGVTTNLKRQLLDNRERKTAAGGKKRPRRQKTAEGMKLVYYEILPCMDAAEQREQMLKNMSRQERVHVIEARNPKWGDLGGEL